MGFVRTFASFTTCGEVVEAVNPEPKSKRSVVVPSLLVALAIAAIVIAVLVAKGCPLPMPVPADAEIPVKPKIKPSPMPVPASAEVPPAKVSMSTDAPNFGIPGVQL